ncbi:hypothetical protein [Bizionia paragorgiae]|uniref:hypothetical protein n=1 Tax=Bizionia paragorgiae TaxID=283786 RepID=UPI00115FB398|nr:hypothetical protein [Bizionia paragorgiae]MDX1272220.1 hypothetical protein [Bizionia paragorgiae]
MFSQKKNKKFNYKSRFSDNENGEEQVLKATKQKEISSEWEQTRRTVRKNKKSSLPILLLLLALIIGIMYYLDIKLR